MLMLIDTPDPRYGPEPDQPWRPKVPWGRRHPTARVRIPLVLAVLLAGSVVPNPHLVLSSDRMHDLLTDARAAADVVIIDAPALATVSDALTLTPALDTCIFVMRLNRTTGDRARRALKALREAGVDIAGVVITGTKPAGAYRSGFRSTRLDRRAKTPDVALLLQSEAARNGSDWHEVPDELRTPKR